MIGYKGFTSRKSFCPSGSQKLFFGGREATTGYTSAVRRLGQCVSASFYRAYQIRLNSRGTHLQSFFFLFFSKRKMNTLTCFVIDLLKK